MSLLHRAVRSAPARWLLRSLERLEGGSTRLRALTYHTIEDADGFREQVRHIARHYRPVTGEAVARALGGGDPLPARALLVTFDDAYRNFAEVAWPILRAEGVPALLFVPTGYPDRPGAVFWWDTLAHALASTALGRLDLDDGTSLRLESSEQRQQALRELKGAAHAVLPRELGAWSAGIAARLGVDPPESAVLGWKDLGELARQGVELGSHSRSHPFLDRLEEGQLEDEVAGSLADFETHLGWRPRTFAYPNGRHSPRVVEAVRAAGIALAFTIQRGSNEIASADPLRLRRINIGPRGDASVLQARLCQSGALLTRLRPLEDRYEGPLAPARA